MQSLACFIYQINQKIYQIRIRKNHDLHKKKRTLVSQYSLIFKCDWYIFLFQRQVTLQNLQRFLFCLTSSYIIFFNSNMFSIKLIPIEIHLFLRWTEHWICSTYLRTHFQRHPVLIHPGNAQKVDHLICCELPVPGNNFTQIIAFGHCMSFLLFQTPEKIPLFLVYLSDIQFLRHTRKKEFSYQRAKENV